MKLSTITPLLLVPLAARAFPAFTWGNDKSSKDIPELSVAEWEAIRNPTGAASYAYSKAAEWLSGQEDNDVSDDSELTIWQLLNKDQDKYSKVTKLISLIPKAKEVLDDREGSITFFAPENSGIPDPHHHHHHGDDDDDDDESLTKLAQNPSIESLYRHHVKISEGHHDDDDDEKKRRRKEIFKFIVGQVLKYHGLPEALTASELASNNSVATALIPKFGANDGQPLRLRVEKQLVPPFTKADIKAKNGYIHSVAKPLIPPPSVLDAAFLFPSKFSTFTSAIQKVGGEGAVMWEYNKGESDKAKHPVFVGAPAVTAFVPTNEAFGKLPERLVMFLFSPFGTQCLRAVLQYHILPSSILFTEHLHKVGSHHGKRGWIVDEVKQMMDNDPSYHVEVDLPTLFNNTKLHIVVDKSRVVPVPGRHLGAIKTKLTVNDIEASTYDIPALNGAVHVLPEVLKPHYKHPHKITGELVEGRWENWEDWLVDWAESI
ncbi:hypothetical protein QFC22_003341 [Naganishia vaughanmartiniae]|uniref:Uncharacterized protein n=1 Tax=Naganishia vaughanmartiniae TaxID=1424756 RepID=A0ACC2X6V4_9TREE|nr:hypothetical protein QFC22_003341 [Naganishia vaughanmartiniae]